MLLPLLLSMNLMFPGAAPDCSPSAPSFEQSVLFGKVVDPAGAPIPQAKVMAKSRSGEHVYRTADRNGCYEIRVSAGDYTVSAVAAGFEETASAASAGPAAMVRQDLHLKPRQDTNRIGVTAGTQPASIRLCIIDDRSRPVPTAIVTVLSSGHDPDAQKMPLDEWGCGAVTLPKGSYTVFIAATGYQTIRRPVVLEGEQAQAPVARIRLISRHDEHD